MLVGNDKNANREEHFSDLIKEAEKGDSFLIMTSLSTYDFSLNAIDEAFRCCMRNFPPEKEDQKEFMNCFKSFIEHYNNFNFTKPEEGNQTILMEAVTLGLKCVFDLILKYAERIPREINLKITDSQGENVMDKIINSNKLQDEEKVEMTKELISFGYNINLENSKGLSALATSLITGNSKMAESLLELGANINHVVPSTGDNILHCAIYGKNPTCLTVLSERNVRKFNELKNKKNKISETPVDLAAKMGLTKFLHLLGEQTLNTTKVLSMTQPLEEFRQGHFHEALRLLEEIRQSTGLGLSVQWNTLLVKLLDPETQMHDEKVSNNLSNFFLNFEKDESNKIPKNNILQYNYALYYMKLANYKQVVKNITENVSFQKNVSHLDWILFVNISLIFIQIFIEMKQPKVVGLLIKNVEDFLSNILKDKKRETLNENICQYISSTELFNDMYNLDDCNSVLNLFKAYKSLLEFKSEETKKYIKEYKRVSALNSTKPIFLTMKRFYHYLKIKLDYQNNSFFKCYKHLNSFLQNEKACEAHLYYYNSLGIINLRHKRYSLSISFFKHAFHIIKQNIGPMMNRNSEWLKYAAFIRYNIGLCHFYEKKWVEAMTFFQSVKSFLPYSPYLHYRIGLCSLELAIGLMKQESLNYYNDMAEKILGYDEAKNKFSDSADTGNQKSVTEEKIYKRILLRNNSAQGGPYSLVFNKYLHDAVHHFKQTLCLIKSNNGFKKEIENVCKFFEINQADENTNIIENKCNSNVTISCYFNIIFSHLLLREWTSVLFYAAEFEKSPFFNREFEYNLDNYKIEAYLALNQHNNIIEILKKNMLNNNFSYLSLDFKGSFYNKVNKTVYSEINYKLALYINIIKMNFITNNLLEVEKGIFSILNMLNVNFSSSGGINHGDLPPYVLNLVIYYLVLKENFEGVMNVIKYRRLPANFLNTIPILNTKNIK